MKLQPTTAVAYFHMGEAGGSNKKKTKKKTSVGFAESPFNSYRVSAAVLWTAVIYQEMMCLSAGLFWC